MLQRLSSGEPIRRQAPASAAEPSAHRKSTRDSDLIRVLLVDDNAATLARVTAALTPACVVVGTIIDARAALEAAHTLCPDVIVLDISMPRMNGLELAMRLRQTGSKAALVFLTVHDEDEFIRAAQDAGAIGYVVKPRLAVDLLFAVREARAGRRFCSVTR